MSLGCADIYRVPDAAFQRAASLPPTVQQRVVLPAVRQADNRPTLVFSTLVTPDPDAEPAPAGQRVVRENNSSQRLSRVGLPLLIAGAVVVSLGVVAAEGNKACGGGGGPIPCIGTGGDLSIPAFTIGAGSLLAGLGLMLARATGIHPAEAPPYDDDLVYLGAHTSIESAPSQPAPAPPAPEVTKTPLE